MQKIISIVGQTATGKTLAALALAKELLLEAKKRRPTITGVDLISADSRQVYQGLEITSGADIPRDWQRANHPQLPFSFFFEGKLRLHGVSILRPTQAWSVGQFSRLAKSVLALAKKENRLLILVGGTGLYHQLAFKNDWQLQVGPNQKIRTRASQMTLDELKNWAMRVATKRFSKLNISDRNNPRRLIRVLELTKYQLEHQPNVDRQESVAQIYFGLKAASEITREKIIQRVKARLAQGAMSEVKNLTKNYKLGQAESTLGIKQIMDYLSGSLDLDECITAWAQAEMAYAKRQETWWKRKKFVKWIEQKNSDWLFNLQAMALREYFSYNEG